MGNKIREDLKGGRKSDLKKRKKKNYGGKRRLTKQILGGNWKFLSTKGGGGREGFSNWGAWASTGWDRISWESPQYQGIQNKG